MNIQNIKLNSINQVKFSGSQTQPKPEQVVQEEKKVPLNYDTARAYASYGIHKPEKHANNSQILLNDLDIKIQERKDSSDKILISIINGNGQNDNESEPQQGMVDIQNAIMRAFGNMIAEKFNVPTLGFTTVNGSVIGVECPPENYKAAINIAKFLLYNTDKNEVLFNKAKQAIKDYYKETFGKEIVREKGKPYYDNFKYAKSLAEIYEKLDNISFKDYQKYSANHENANYTIISADIPKGKLTEQMAMDIEKQILKDTTVSGKYKCETEL